MTISLRGALRRCKADKYRQRIKPRLPADLLTVSDLPQMGRPMLLLDTNVYIMAVAGTLPDVVASLIDRALLFHCSVCLSELATGVANTNPENPTWRAIRDHYTALIDTVPDTRLLIPDGQIWLEAGAIAGTLARTQNFQKYQRKECLNDALISLCATKAGLPVLTANREDFDLIQQLVPDSRFVYF